MSASNTRRHLAVRLLCEGAIMLALGLILSNLPLYRLPNGGSVSLDMLPILFFAVRWGLKPGLAVGLIFGVLQIFTEGAIAWGWQSLLLDFVVAFAPLGLAGLFRGKSWGIFAGTMLGGGARFVVHFISGVTIYAILVPTELFEKTYTNPALYSLVYNGSYMLIDIILCLVIFGLLRRPLRKFFMAEDLR